MRIVCGSHFWQLGSVASLATETTGDSSSILAQTWPQSDLRVPNFKFFLGSMPPDPPSLFILQ